MSPYPYRLLHEGWDPPEADHQFKFPTCAGTTEFSRSSLATAPNCSNPYAPSTSQRASS